jgi:hypothetical protein
MGINHLCIRYVGIPPETSVVNSHQNRRISIIVENVEGIEHLLELVRSPKVIVVVPGINNFRMDFHLKTGDNAEIVPSTPHCPKEVSILLVVDFDLGAIRKDNIHVNQVVSDQTMNSFVAAMATTQARTHHTYAIASAGSF